ncbi:MAG: hypothetical protein H6832_10260 [Planctomycetes bacterium]|nr:hypothetical protein [Planctomycetota bacterium]MCB9918772.1 hypothetical protein [Planctomycetota bacterium]
MQSVRICCVLTLLLVPWLSAQRTITANDQQLASAILGANPGDIILFNGTYVHSGSQPFVIDKPLFIHCRLPSQIMALGGVEVRGIPAGQAFVLQYCYVRDLVVNNCAGRVLFAEVIASAYPGMGSVTVTGCDDVTFEGCAIGALAANRSRVTAGGGTSIRGQAYDSQTNQYPAGSPAITLVDSALRFGGVSYAIAGAPQNGAQPGITMDATSSVVLFRASNVASAGNTSMSAIHGNGTLEVGLKVNLTPVGTATPIDPRIRVTNRRAPLVVARPSDIGTQATVLVVGADNAVFALFLGRPGPVAKIPGTVGEFTLEDPLLVASGTIVTTAVGFFVKIPNAPVLRALPFRWQAATLLGTTIEWSLPVTECHK